MSEVCLTASYAERCLNGINCVHASLQAKTAPIIIKHHKTADSRIEAKLLVVQNRTLRDGSSSGISRLSSISFNGSMLIDSK